MTDTARDLRNAAKRLHLTVTEMLAPASATPSPQRMKLDKALHAVERALIEYDASRPPGTIADALEIVGEYNRGELDHGNRDDG